GISTGAEERKMGIKGSSTRQVYLENVKVPVENMLGEIHKGYKIAFNILNIGRLKLGAGAAAGSRTALNLAATYTTERKAFGKFHGSEVLAYVVDEGVQIFGGYGFMQEYPIEKAYRDARIQRIYEGTNEINRLVTSGTLFRRVMSGKLDLMSRIPAIEARVKSGQAPEIAGEDIPAELRGAVNALERAKDVTIYAAMRIAMKYMQALEQ